MKIIFALFFFVALTVNCFGAGATVSSLNGSSTNLSDYGSLAQNGVPVLTNVSSAQIAAAGGVTNSFATPSQAIAGTSSNTIISPFTLNAALTNLVEPFEPTNGISQSNGFGTNTTLVNPNISGGNGVITNQFNPATGWPQYELLSNKWVRLPNGTSTNFAASTTAGIMEIQALNPWTTNGIGSGFRLNVAAGFYPFSSQIFISNNCVIEGAGWSSSVFYYCGQTNTFTVALVTSTPQSAALWCIPTNGTPEPENGDVTPAPNVTLQHFTIMASNNMTAIIIYSYAYNLNINDVMLGGPDAMKGVTTNYSFGLIQPSMVNFVPGLVGIYCLGSTLNQFHNVFLNELADGIVINEPGASYNVIDSVFPQVIGRYGAMQLSGTLYPSNSILSLGAGVIMQNSYSCSIQHLYPYYCICPLVIGAGANRVENFVDQSSTHQLMAFLPDSTYSIIDLIGDVNGAAFLTVTNAANGDYRYNGLSGVNNNGSQFTLHNASQDAGFLAQQDPGESWNFCGTNVFGYDLPNWPGDFSQSEFDISPLFPLRALLTYSTGLPSTSITGKIPTNNLPQNGNYLTNIPPSALSLNASPHIPVAVTLGASPFLFANTTPNPIECFFSGSVAYSVSKNGVGVFGSLASDGYLILQPTNACTITYTVAPTVFTNAW